MNTNIYSRPKYSNIRVFKCSCSSLPASWMKQAGEKLEGQDPGRGEDVPKGVKRKRIQDTEEVRT